MSSNFHIVIKNVKEGKHMFMYVVLHGIAQIPVGKAQNLAQNELKLSYSDEEHQRRQTYVYVCSWPAKSQLLNFFGRFKMG